MCQTYRKLWNNRKDFYVSTAKNKKMLTVKKKKKRTTMNPAIVFICPFVIEHCSMPWYMVATSNES